jgi:respiratory burst oxidase
LTLIAHGARQWLGVGVPLGLLAVAPMVFLYLYERVMDIWRSRESSIRIARAVLKKKSVLLEIDIGNSGITYATGMYSMLQDPAISEYQWHPFTIASAGGQRTFQVLIAIVGDWTTQLSELIRNAQKVDAQNPIYPVIHVRGGYGAPAAGMKDKTDIILVGAG